MRTACKPATTERGHRYKRRYSSACENICKLRHQEHKKTSRAPATISKGHMLRALHVYVMHALPCAMAFTLTSQGRDYQMRHAAKGISCARLYLCTSIWHACLHWNAFGMQSPGLEHLRPCGLSIYKLAKWKVPTRAAHMLIFFSWHDRISAYLKGLHSVSAPTQPGKATPDLHLMRHAPRIQLGSLLVAAQGILDSAGGQVGAEGHPDEGPDDPVELSHLIVPSAHEVVREVAAHSNNCHRPCAGTTPSETVHNSKTYTLP